ncbi:MAG TPA: protein kinase [Bacteroidota bacterium]|nr:protein kinase [Bacteroidota bacterium]
MDPSTISHYEILEKLGEGGMGVVYKARDTRLGRTVALKFLPVHYTRDEAGKERFLREARAAAALNHSNICTVYGVEEHDGRLFISMEYVDGGTIRQKIPYPSVEDAIRAAMQIGEALHEAHARGLVHRDIKAENIMLTSRGVIKVMDFGLAEPRGSSDPQGQFGLAGTPAYMAPEQIQGGTVDSRSDIFSFGVLLYEMLAGRLPFRGEHEASLMYSIQHEDPPPLSAVRTDIPPQFEQIIRRALEKDVTQRYQDVQTMVNLFKEVKTGSPKSSRHLLAVLPFDNISPDRGDDYVSEGLTDEIITSLSRLQGLNVISRTSVMRYRERNRSLKEIAAELNATYVLEGSVRKSGQELKITVQLIDADRDVNLWADSYRGNLSDIFDIQEKVAGRIVEALKVRLTPGEKSSLRKRSTGDSEAYQLYLQGRYFWNKRTEAGMNAAIDYFGKAIERDQRYSLAWSGLADAYNLIGTVDSNLRRDLYRRAKSAAEKALEIDDQLAEAHASLALVLMLGEWDWAGAERELKIGIGLHPRYATAHHWYAEWLLYMGRLDEARLEISRAVELDPVSPAIFADKGFVHYYGREYDRAIEMARKSQELDPAFKTIHRLLSLAYQGKQMFDRALEENALWQRATGNEFEGTLARAQILAASGKGDQAREICMPLELASNTNGLVVRGLALVSASLGDADAAFRWLEKGYERKDDWMCTIKVDPKMDKIRPDPRFGSLVRRVGID